MTEAYTVNSSELPLRDDNVLRHISAERIARNKSCIAESAVKSSYAVELLLRYALAKHHFPQQKYAERLRYDENGKPFIPFDSDNGFNLHFSLSHSGAYAMCVVSDKEVGADTEKLRNISDSLYALIVSSHDDKTMHPVSIWSAKEAYLKLCGKGLFNGIALQDLSVADNSVRTAGDIYPPALLFQWYHGNMVFSVCSYSTPICSTPAQVVSDMSLLSSVSKSNDTAYPSIISPSAPVSTAAVAQIKKEVLTTEALLSALNLTSS